MYVIKAYYCVSGYHISKIKTVNTIIGYEYIYKICYFINIFFKL